jgi:LuxR family quorum sensing-dependent transcriptional regulator
MKKRIRPDLNPHEIEALKWSARGLSSQQIADKLGLCKRTVDFYLDNARAKLGALTRIHAVALAVRERIVEP